MRPSTQVMQLAIDDSLRDASPFYEAMAKSYIPALVQRIEDELAKEGYVIVPRDTPKTSAPKTHKESKP